MKNLHAKLAKHMVAIEEILEKSGNQMSSLTLFARNPSNDAQTLILSSETSNEEIRKSFEVVMANAVKTSKLTTSDVLTSI